MFKHACSGSGRYARLGIGVIAIGSIVGCVAWPDDKFKPHVPENAKLPFVDQVYASVNGSGKKHRALTLNDYKDSLRALLKGVMASAESSNDQFWNLGMSTLIGGTAGTLGALSKNIGLTNTGLAVAGAGQIGRTYYSPEQVRNHHVSAHSKLSCISTEISTLSSYQRSLAIASGAEGSLQAVYSLDYIAHSVDTVLGGYRRVLLGMAPQVSTRDDLLRFASEYQAQAKAAEKAASAAGGTTEADPADAAEVPEVATSNSPQTPASGAPAATASTDTRPAAPASEITSTNVREKGARYAARFVDLKVRLEACTKGLISQ